MRIYVLVVALVWMAGCDTKQPPPPAPAKKAEAPSPVDESRRFPKANLVDTQVVNTELMGKPFMPGGTMARYKKGRKEYQMFVAKMSSATAAATTLPDWRTALADAKLIPAYGGYFGTDQGKPVFVFSKGAWIAGVSGLSEKEADAAARPLASNLDF